MMGKGRFGRLWRVLQYKPSTEVMNAAISAVARSTQFLTQPSLPMFYFETVLLKVQQMVLLPQGLNDLLNH